jgi:hypothetical protein
MALIAGFVLLTQKIGNSQVVQVVSGSILVLSLMAFMFVTARTWSRWIFGLLAYGCLRLLGGIFFGPYLSQPLDRQTTVLWFSYAVAACALTARYLGRRPTTVERVGLVSFVSCFALSAAVGSPISLYAGLAALGVCELIQWLVDQGKHRHGPEPLNTFNPPK